MPPIAAAFAHVSRSPFFSFLRRPTYASAFAGGRKLYGEAASRHGYRFGRRLRRFRDFRRDCDDDEHGRQFQQNSSRRAGAIAFFFSPSPRQGAHEQITISRPPRRRDTVRYTRI